MTDIKPFNNWYCHACSETIPNDDFAAHLKDKHKVTAGTGERTMLMHVDGKYHYDYNWRWKIEGLTFDQSVRSLRDKSDMMYHEGE